MIIIILVLKREEFHKERGRTQHHPQDYQSGEGGKPHNPKGGGRTTTLLDMTLLYF